MAVILRPLQTILLLPQPLQLHRKLPLLDLIIREDLEMAREADLLAGPDEPLGRVVLVPLDCVAVVHRELVVEVVVALADGDERGDEVVARGVLVVERRVAEPVRERVDAECGLVSRSGHIVEETAWNTHMMHKAEAQHTSIHESALRVAPGHADNRGDNKRREEDEPDVVPVLPFHNGALGEIRHVGHTGLAPGLDHHPADMGPQEPLVCVVRVEVGVGVAVVGAVTSGPPADGAFDGTGTGNGEEILQGDGGIIGTVCPEAVIARGDAFGDTGEFGNAVSYFKDSPRPVI